MSTPKDLDHELGFWVEGAAYLWAPGATLKQCKRFYILQQNAAAIFDKNNNILDIDFVNTSIKGGNINPHDLFSLFPNNESIGGYKLSNCFLVWTWDIDVRNNLSLTQNYMSMEKQHTAVFSWCNSIEVRIEGNKILSYPKKKFPNNLVRVISPNFSTIVQSYPWRFGNPYDAPPFGIKERIMLNVKDKNVRSFKNLADVQKIFNLSKEDLTRIHIEALRRTLHKFPDDGPMNVIINFYLKKLKAPVTPNKSGSGWEYNSKTSFEDAHVIYETLIEKRPVYIWRDISVNSVENRLKRLSIVPRTFKRWTSSDLEEDPPSIITSYATEENKKHRESMEDEAFAANFGDAWFIGVLDGHGGSSCSEHFAEILPVEIFEKYNQNPPMTLESIKNIFTNVFFEEDKKWFEMEAGFSGTTFTGVLITETKIFSINLGDSRTVFDLSYNRIDQTIDHKPETEHERIKAAGGHVAIGRVQGILAVSRAFGDVGFKCDSKSQYNGDKSTVSVVPTVREYCRKDVNRILIACDGIFDVLSSKKAMEFSDAGDLVREAIKKKSMDNITAMFLKI